MRIASISRFKFDTCVIIDALQSRVPFAEAAFKQTSVFLKLLEVENETE